MPTLATESIGERTELVEFEKPIPGREVGLVYRRAHYKRELIDALARAVLEAVPPEVKRLRKKDLTVIPVEQE